MEFYPENLGEISLPLVGAMGVEYTVGQVRDMITELLGHLSETPEGEETGVTCTALVRLLAFILLEPVPEGVPELSECDRWSALRLLERIRKPLWSGDRVGRIRETGGEGPGACFDAGDRGGGTAP